MERCGRTRSQATTIQQIRVNYNLAPNGVPILSQRSTRRIRLLPPLAQLSYNESILADAILQFDSSFPALSKGQSDVPLREL